MMFLASSGSGGLAVGAFVVALAALLLSLGVGYLQGRQWKTQNSIPVLIDVFREFRSDLQEARQQIGQWTGDAKKIPSSEHGYKALPSNLVQLSHFYDNLGLLAAHKIIRRAVVGAFLAQPIKHAWTILEPFVVAERAKRKEAQPEEQSAAGLAKRGRGISWRRAPQTQVYQNYFEWLAAWCTRHPQSVFYKRINRQIASWREK